MVAILEILASVWVEAPPRPLFDRPGFRVAGRPFIEDHPTRGFALVPGFDDGEIRVNADGLRGAEVPAERGTTIVALGDSTTFGWGVDDDESWPRLLEIEGRAAQGDDSLVVLNAGVPSYTSPQIRLYLDELLPRFDPDRVIVAGQWNDVWFSSLDPWFPEALILRAPSPWRRFLQDHSALYGWFAGRGRTSAARDVADPRALALYRDDLDAMARACEARGVAFAFLQPPLQRSKINPGGGRPLGQVWFTKPFLIETGLRYARAMEEVAASHGAPILDHPLSIGRDPSPTWFVDAIHPSADGNREIARAIAASLELGR